MGCFGHQGVRPLSVFELSVKVQVARSIVRELWCSAKGREIIFVPLGFESEHRLLGVCEGSDVFEGLFAAGSGDFMLKPNAADFFLSGLWIDDCQSGVKPCVSNPEPANRTLARVDRPLVQCIVMRSGRVPNEFFGGYAIANAFTRFRGVTVAQRKSEMACIVVKCL